MMRILLLCCLAVLLLACHKDKMEGLSGGTGEETCALSIALKKDYSLNEVVLTRAGDYPIDGEFKVRIENTRAEVLKEWDYNSLPSLIKVVPGSYKLVAWYGTDSILPVFEKPYYYGETKITLKEGDNLDTLVDVRNAATKVAVAFDESFSFDYEDYFVDIKTVGDSLRFLKDEKREGYFQPGKLRMRFGLKPKGSDNWYQFYPDAIASVKAKEFYKMTLKAQTKNGALSGITISTDSSTIDIPVNVELPPFYFPKAAPKVTPQGFAWGDVIETTEGLSKPATVLVSSAAGLTELKLKTLSDTLIARGWPTEIDLMEATDEQKAVLKSNGLEWSDELNTKDTIKTTVWVKFNNTIKLLNTAPGNTASSAFEINVKDKFGQVGSSDCKFDVRVAPPMFEFLTTPGEGNVFAKRAIYDVKYASEVRTPVVECKGSDGNWTSLETVLNETTENAYECLGKGLTPKTNYAFRVRLGEHVLDAGNYTTEEILSVPNANMDSWYLETQKTVIGQKTYIYHACASGEKSPWWANNNVRSTWWTFAPVEQNSAPAVSYLTERSGKVAEIRSIGSGSGCANTSSICYDGSRIPGMLFVGDYSYDKPNETINYGRPFASRPFQMKFWYNYTPYNNEEFEAYIEIQNREGGTTNILGSGVLRSAVGTSDYVQAIIDLEYVDRTKKATHMFIRFLSSTNAQPAVEKNVSINLEEIKNGWKAHVGSRLKIDDIELKY